MESTQPSAQTFPDLRETAEPTSKVSDAPASNDDRLSKMIQFGVDNNSQEEMTRINDAIDMLKQKHGISVREHLGFDNAATQQLKFHTHFSG